MDFKVLFSQLVVLYEKLTKQQKIIIASAIVGIVAFLIFLVLYSSTKEKDSSYVPLFDSLNSDDAAKVMKQLDVQGVPYKVGDNNVIEVPKSKVYKLRISIAASEGITKDSVGVGFELFDNQEFGATSFDQKIKLLRAREGELARTIIALSPIKSASVSLAIPKETLFIATPKPPTASVMITLNSGRVLSSKQIRGIKNLVASAIPNLVPKNVMLVDASGETLGDESENVQMGELSMTQQKYKLKEEQKAQEKIVSVIAPFVGGTQKVVAQVTIEYDFSIQNSTSEKYDPENVVRSEQTSEEKREGGSPKQVGGVPGTVSNIGPVKGLSSNAVRTKYEKNTGTTNYEVSKTVSTTKSQFARIKKINAAVIVDGKYKLQDPKDPKSAKVYTPLSETDLEALRSLASRSIGIDKQRGDQISVENLQFTREGTVKEVDGVTKAMAFSQTYLAPFSGLFKYLFVVVLLLIVYKKVISPFAERMLEISKEEDDLEKPALDLDDDEEEDLVEKVQAMRKKVEDQLGVGDGFNEDDLKHDVLLDKVRTMAEDNVEEIAALLQALLSEELDSSQIKDKG